MSDSDLKVVTQYLEDNQQMVYIQVAMLTLMILNIIVTFTHEVERIWTAQQSAVTVIFYVIRYLPPLWTGFALWSHASYSAQISEGGCRFLWCVDLIMTMVTIGLSESLVLMRIWALYSFNCRVVAFFVVIFLAGVGLQVWGSVQAFAALIRVPRYPGSVSIPGCQINYKYDPGIPVLVSIAYAMATSLIMFIFMLNRCWARNSFDQPFLGSWRDLLGIRTALPVVHVLMRDGCAYFLIILCLDLCLFLIGYIERSILSYGLVLAQTIYSVPATRMVLNLRGRLGNGIQRAGVRPADISLGIVSDVHFARRSTFDAGMSYIKPNDDGTQG